MNAVFDAKERKQERLNSGIPDAISPNLYNGVIGLLLLYGFGVNALMVHLCSGLMLQIPPLVFLIVYFILCFAGTACAASDKPGMSFLGYNLIVVPIGAVLSLSLPDFDSDLIMTAMLYTGSITAVMTALASFFPQLFSGLGKALGIALLVTLILSLVSCFFFDGAGEMIFLWVGAGIFTLYIGYDWYKAQAYPKTLDNAVDSALDLYLDIINLFLKILRILAKARRDD